MSFVDEVVPFPTICYSPVLLIHPPVRDPKPQALFLALINKIIALNAVSSLGMVLYGELWPLRVEFAPSENPRSERHSCKLLNLVEITS